MFYAFLETKMASVASGKRSSPAGPPVMFPQKLMTDFCSKWVLKQPKQIVCNAYTETGQNHLELINAAFTEVKLCTVYVQK